MTTPLAILPANKLFKGAFFAVELGNYDLAFSNNNFVAEWKARFDIAKANGLNCVEFLCSINDWDSMGQGLYFAKLKQIFDYAGKIGMHIILIHGGAMSDYGVSVSTAITRAIALVQFASRWAGIVLCFAAGDENFQIFSGTYAASTASMYAPIKAAAPPNLPIAASTFYVQSSNNEWDDLQTYAAYSDVFIANLNTGTPSGAKWDALRGNFPNHQFIFNVGYGQSDGAFTTNFAAQNILGTQNVIGSLIFTQEDYAAAAGGTGMGLYVGIGTGENVTRTNAMKAAFGATNVSPIPSRRVFRPGNHRLNNLTKLGIAA